jgi:O-antigen ligase
MSLIWIDKLSLYAFNFAAFAILGFLFVFQATTWGPTLVVLVAAIASIILKDFRERCKYICTKSPYMWISVPFVIWFFVSLVLELFHSGNSIFHFPENELRIFLALTLLAMYVGQSSRICFLLGLLLAGCAAVFWAFQAWPWSLSSRAQATTNNAIHFGNLSALTLVLALTVALVEDNLLVRYRIIFLIAALGGLVGSLSSLSRSSFMALLCLTPLVFIPSNIRPKRNGIFVIYIFFIIIILVALASVELRDLLRISAAIEEFQQILDGNYDSPLGARVAMWKAAWLIFIEHPYIGIGSGNFQDEMTSLMHLSKIPEAEIFNQPHSDIMHALSSGGLLKLVSYLGILAGPFVFFLKCFSRIKTTSNERLMSLLGMEVVGVYFLTGLTNSNFDLQIYSTTYAVLVCVIARLSSDFESKKYE